MRTRLSHQTPDTVSHTIFKAVGIEARVTRTHTRSDTSSRQLGASCTPAAPHAPAAPLNAFFDTNAPTTPLFDCHPPRRLLPAATTAALAAT